MILKSVKKKLKKKIEHNVREYIDFINSNKEKKTNIDIMRIVLTLLA